MSSNEKRMRFEYNKLVVSTFVFAFIRGPFFKIEDIVQLGWNRRQVRRTVNSLVKSGVLEKLDQRTYGPTLDAREWFRRAFGGGVNDAPFAYYALEMNSWGQSRLDHFKSKLSQMWNERAERFQIEGPTKSAPATFDPTLDTHALVKLLCEKMDEASYVATSIVKMISQDDSRKTII
jgi:hypothetical protein